MKKPLFILVIILFVSPFYAQEITINYHDPNHHWETFSDTLEIKLESPDQTTRNTTLKLDLPKDYFYLKATRDTNTTEFTLIKDSCAIKFNDKSTFTKNQIKKYGLTCDRAKMYKNYYTYLYGLPMKLKDDGTQIAPKVTHKTLNGKDYLVLRVTYDENVGSDIWYFYINPNSYAMEAYQFFHTNKETKELDPNSGEYILLKEIKIIKEIKMPKIRAWYTNKDNKLLGTDILQ